MYFKQWIESQVIAHVSGASGSGKTTLANNLSKKYTNFIFKDLDEFDDEAEKILNFKVKKQEYTDEMLESLFKQRQLLMDKFIKNSDKPIVFVGHHTEGKHVLDIPTKNRFLLDVDAKTSARRAYLRSQKEDPKYRRTLSDLPDDEKEAQETIDWLNKNGYRPLSQEEIKKWLKRK